MMPMSPRTAATSRLGAMGVAPDENMRADAGKVAMSDAHYRQATDPATCCGTCSHFDGVSTCDVVAGQIDARGVSDIYEPAAAASAAPAAPVGPAGP